MIKLNLKSIKHLGLFTFHKFTLFSALYFVGPKPYFYKSITRPSLFTVNIMLVTFNM